MSDTNKDNLTAVSALTTVTIESPLGEKITYTRNSGYRDGYWSATQEGMSDVWGLSRVASRAIDRIADDALTIAALREENAGMLRSIMAHNSHVTVVERERNDALATAAMLERHLKADSIRLASYDTLAVEAKDDLPFVRELPSSNLRSYVERLAALASTPPAATEEKP